MSVFRAFAVGSTAAFVFATPVASKAGASPLAPPPNPAFARWPVSKRIPTDSIASRDPIERLQARLQAGTLSLPRDSAFGYLPALLRALNIPTSSQALVFSRTSLQSDLIAPWVPRALYFNDDVYVGFVQDSDFLEIATVNAVTGVAFYTLIEEPNGHPAIVREGNNSCLLCHQSKATTGVPGFIMLSTITDRLGYPITNVHGGSTTDQTPIRQRFGGWYVTGTDGPTGHSGNVHSAKDFNQVEKERYREQIDLTVESARTDLAGKFDAALYLTAHSDLVALMVLVHQTSVHNLMASVQAAARQALLEEAVIDRYRTDSLQHSSVAISNIRLRDAIEKLVRALLFLDEAALESPMQGSTSFVEDFARRGPRDDKGRSLRDFDLQHRLFRYPLSFLIYSEGFDALPAVAKQGVYARLRAVLTGDDTSASFTRLTQGDRKAVLEILRATKPEVLSSGSQSATR